MASRIGRSLIAVVSLLAGGIASAGPMQQRVDALAQQLELRYARSPRALDDRRDAVAVVLSEWNKLTGEAKNSPDNRSRLNAWLDDALAASMPGGSGKLAAPPEFSLPVEAPRESQVSDAAPVESGEPNAAEAPATGRPAEARVPASREKLPTPPAGRTPIADESEVAYPSAAPEPRRVAKPVAPNAAESESPAAPSSKWSQHPAAAPLEWRDPFADDPQASPNPLRTGTRRESLKPLEGEGASVRVNLSTLAAEIRGYNAAVRALHRRLAGAASAADQDLRLAEQELADLRDRRAFLQTYRNRVSQEQRWGLPELASSDALGELLRRSKS